MTYADYTFDGNEIFWRLFKYLFDGLVVALAAYFIPGKKLELEEILVLALIASAIFAVLDLTSMGAAVRSGAGFGIGANLVGFPGGTPAV